MPPRPGNVGKYLPRPGRQPGGRGGGADRQHPDQPGACRDKQPLRPPSGQPACRVERDHEYQRELGEDHMHQHSGDAEGCD